MTPHDHNDALRLVEPLRSGLTYRIVSRLASELRVGQGV